MQLPLLNPVTAALLGVAERLRVVDHQSLPLTEVAGRILARGLVADRDNPPTDVSAMDGYAMRLDPVPQSRWPIAGVATAGAAPPPLPPHAVVQIFTGAPVPQGADCVVPREQTRETPAAIELLIPPSELRVGQNIRYRGENAAVGSQVLAAGTWLGSSAMAAVASLAGSQVDVYRQLRVAVINTGDEIVPPGQPALQWQIRDSNGPVLRAALSDPAWLNLVSHQQVPDQLDLISSELEHSLAQADAVILTGGVSMGDTDHVPAAVQAVGGEILFHRLPIRPGKPVLAAVTGHGKLIVGLPGNPVSVAVTAAVIAMPLLRKQAGMHRWLPAAPLALVEQADDKQLKLQWYRLVQLLDNGAVKYVDSRGSGDLISLAVSDGFITLPAGGSGPGPWPLTFW